jgi:actin-related protein
MEHGRSQDLIKLGIVNNWHDMEKIWQYIYTEELKSASEDVFNDI